MIRTSRVAVVAVVLLAACGDARSNDNAAEVGDAAVSRDDFEALTQAIVADPEVFGIQEDVATGTIPGDAGRNILRLLILNAAGKQFVADSGESITDADREAAREFLGQQVEGLPEDVVAVAVDQRAGATAIGRVAASSGDPRAQYEASPADLGVLCVRHIVVETEEEADAVLEALANGADFAELAAERSIEPTATETGGALELQPGQPCIPLDQAAASLDGTFVDGATEAVPGTPIGPIQTTFGWHVVLARPYEEVADAVNTEVGQLLFDEHLATTDIEVDPRYGRWDPVERSVVPL